MRTLSLWAKHHARTARTIIIIIHFLLAGLAFIVGTRLEQLGVYLSPSMMYITLLVFIVAAFCYPDKKNGPAKANTYVRQKTLDFIIGVCSFIVMCCVTNNLSQPLPVAQPAYASTGIGGTILSKKPTAQEILASLEHRDKSTLTRAEKRILKKEFNHQLLVYAKAKASGNDDEANTALLIILAVIGALGLVFLLLGLVCSISCGGSEAAAVLVAILGLAAIIWLFVFVVNKIHHRKGKGADKTDAEKMHTMEERMTNSIRQKLAK